MRAVRVGLSLAMIVVGAVIVVRMFPYPLAQSFTGIVLGAAMIALGAVRLRTLYGTRRS